MSNVHLIVSWHEISSSFGPIDATLPEYYIIVDASLNLPTDIVLAIFENVMSKSVSVIHIVPSSMSEFVTLAQTRKIFTPSLFESSLHARNFPFVASGFSIRSIQTVISSSQNTFNISEPVVASIPLTSENIDVLYEE